MSEPPFHPFEDGSGGAWSPEEEPTAPDQKPSGLARPAALVAGGLVLGVIATLVVSALSRSPDRPAAIIAASSATVAATSPSSTARTSTKPSVKATTTKPKSTAPVVLPPANQAGLAHAAAASIRITKIGVYSTLANLGLQKDGTLQTPTDYGQAGWYSQGAYPGDANDPPAIVAGHVDNYRGPAIFYRLRELTAGDKVQIVRADGSVANFVVYQTANVLKSEFNAQAVYATSQRPELRLITCTGQFDTSARSYLSNFVVYAYLTGGG